MTTLENISKLNGQLAETKALIPLSKDINEVRVLTNTMVSIEKGINKLNEVKAEKERADIRQRVEHLTFFATCKETLKAYLLEASDENKGILLGAIKELVKTPLYFSGTSGERFVSIEVAKGGKIAAYFQTDEGPVIGSDSLGLIKFKEVKQFLGLLIKHNGINTAMVSELFKLDLCQPTTKIELDSVKTLFAAIRPNVATVRESFKEIEVTLGYITVITIDQNGKKSFKQKPVLGTTMIESANGVVSRFKAHNRLQEKSVVNAKNAFISGAKAGLKEVTKKK